MDRNTQQVQRIFLSADGDMGSHAQTRPLAVVPIDHFTGDIVLRAFPIAADPTTADCFSVPTLLITNLSLIPNRP